MYQKHNNHLFLSILSSQMRQAYYAAVRPEKGNWSLCGWIHVKLPSALTTNCKNFIIHRRQAPFDSLDKPTQNVPHLLRMRLNWCAHQILLHIYSLQKDKWQTISLLTPGVGPYHPNYHVPPLRRQSSHVVANNLSHIHHWLLATMPKQ